MDLRSQRIENEWAIFCQMADANPECITAKKRFRDEFLLVLEGTTAPVCRDHQVVLVREHELRFSFARFFPAVPIEAYLSHPVFHPNVHPASGFVCLWNRFSRADTTVDALCQLQRILTYAVFSESPDDVMQPDALEWAIKGEPGVALPLPCTPLVKPPSWPEGRGFGNPPARRRLSPPSICPTGR